MVAPGNANSPLNLILPLYDAAGNRVNVALRAVNITTDPDTNAIYGDLAVGEIIPGTGASDLGKAENAAYAQGDVGVAMLGARNDAFNALTTADGRYSFFQLDISGRLLTVSYGPIDINTGIPLSNGTGLFVNAYPLGATPITAASGNVANAVATATLANASGKTTYITGFQVTGAGATAGLPVIVTVTNVVTGTMSYIYSAAVGVLVENTPLIVKFDPPVPANAANTAIAVSCPALGAGNTNNTVNAQGYQL